MAILTKDMLPLLILLKSSSPLLNISQVKASDSISTADAKQNLQDAGIEYS
jgi:hypothetical protein